MIIKSIEELEKEGWLKREKRRGKSTIYRLVIPKPAPKENPVAIETPMSGRTTVFVDGQYCTIIPYSEDDDDLPF